MSNLKSITQIFKFILTSITFTLILLYSYTLTSATHCPSSDYDCQISEIQKEIDALKPAHEYNKQELTDLRKQITSLTQRINTLSTQLVQKEKEIKAREEDLAYAEAIFTEKSKNHYKFIRLYDPLMPFFSSEGASVTLKEITFRQKAASEDIKTMEKYGRDLISLRNDKETLEKNKTNLSSAKIQVQQREKFLAGEVEKTEKYLTTLTSKQEELVALKAGGFSTSVGDTPATLEPCSGPPGSSNFCDPGFKPAFAAFSFGAPHRTGMSQYGALGRSKSGQSAETILSAYYQGAELKKDYSMPGTIGVAGYGRIAFEENYLLGIYEVPEKWGNEGGFEALKAQAVAARSFALAYTGGGGGTICTTEACQVYKPQLKSGKWAEAVRATRGWVLTKGGSPAKTYYASTSGGFTVSQWGWTGIKDAKDGSWPGSAFEKIAGSPWFYKAWYRTRGGSTCGEANPWLTSSEMADILNAWQVITKGGADTSRVTPLTTSCWGGNPYSISELVALGGYTDVTGASVVYGNDGSTLSVTFSTNKGSVSIAGAEFKKAFNLRAPGYIGLKSSLYNIEKL